MLKYAYSVFTLCIISIFIFGCTSNQTLEEITPEGIDQLSRGLMSQYNENNISILTHSFHFPPNYPENKFKEDTTSLNRIFSNFTSFWGKITTIEPTSKPQFQMNLGITTSDRSYWSKISAFKSAYYNVSFEKYPNAVLGFDFCQIGESIELGKFTVMGLISNNLDSLARETRINSVVDDLDKILNHGRVFTQ